MMRTAESGDDDTYEDGTTTVSNALKADSAAILC